MHFFERCAIGCPDLVKLASAFGAVGTVLDSDAPDAIAAAVEANLGQPGMRIVGVNQDPNLKPVGLI